VNSRTRDVVWSVTLEQVPVQHLRCVGTSQIVLGAENEVHFCAFENAEFHEVRTPIKVRCIRLRTVVYVLKRYIYILCIGVCLSVI
jgi:hypothetical protein